MQDSATGDEGSGQLMPLLPLAFEGELRKGLGAERKGAVHRLCRTQLAELYVSADAVLELVVPGSFYSLWREMGILRCNSFLLFQIFT